MNEGREQMAMSADELDELVHKGIEEMLPVNTAIWELVEKSDPSELKKVEVGRKFLAIDAYPQIEKATKIFGPMGIGFGLTDIKHQVIADVDCSTSKKPNATGHIVVMEALFWYRFPGTQQLGQIPVVNSLLLTAHNDAFKKLVTNCISKALSYLGFNYDVFKGQWDDNPYADRPDIPSPQFMIDNLKLMLRFGVDNEILKKGQAKSVVQFQINAGWTLQSVTNSTNAIKEIYAKAGKELPDLKTEEDDNGVPEDEAKVEASEKNQSRKEKKS